MIRAVVSGQGALDRCWGTKTSWGGSQGVHESSSWGHLVFNLKGEEVTAIRKRLILGTYKNWKGAKHGEADVLQSDWRSSPRRKSWNSAFRSGRSSARQRNATRLTHGGGFCYTTTCE